MSGIARRGLICAGLAILLAGCATQPPSPDVSSPKLTLTEAFSGRTTGIGVFTVPLTGLERRFTARLNGTLRGDRLIVTEDFVYDDGVKERLTWRFRRTGPATWDGAREDTVGTARVTEKGSEIRLENLADIKSKGEVTRLGFSDVIFRRADGVVINNAVVTRHGLPIGTVHFELRRR